METLGSCLATCLEEVRLVSLRGALGAGKTTLVQGILKGLGHTGSAKSPTFSLVEPYELGGRAIFHFDLYRLKQPEELEFMGIRDFFDQASLVLVEWPEKGAGVLPPADADIILARTQDGRSITWEAHTPAGKHAFTRFQAQCLNCS
ncbi:MAG: tRNA (adenosine(37)-N6)-threonylcarbamoyltransferase complex ATPase subunit type 1 TsaE [Gammaproteobacteria bacterium]|nr:tRNA (adenosine(37)-N6)-threonylcarbamoyltransferase complex ATPase subunit type 1 TsaE [Gammaproteobacteria bacterium]